MNILNVKWEAHSEKKSSDDILRYFQHNSIFLQNYETYKLLNRESKYLNYSRLFYKSFKLRDLFECLVMVLMGLSLRLIFERAIIYFINFYINFVLKVKY